MQLPECELERVFDKVAAVREHLKHRALEGLQPELDWETLADIIADMYKLKINIFEVKASGHFVAGNVERYETGQAVIMVKSQQTEAMLRFVVVKELCHLMIDDEDDWSKDPLQTIKEMKTEFDLARNNGGGVDDPSRTQMSETLALVAAVALVYPCEYHQADFEKLRAGEKTIARIALEHGVPGYAVEMAFEHEDVFALYKGV